MESNNRKVYPATKKKTIHTSSSSTTARTSGVRGLDNVEKIHGGHIIDESYIEVIDSSGNT